MIFADASPISYFLATALVLASAATVVGLVVGLVLIARGSTRKTGQQTLFVVALSIAAELGMLIVLALLDTR